MLILMAGQQKILSKRMRKKDRFICIDLAHCEMLNFQKDFELQIKTNKTVFFQESLILIH